MAAIKGKNTKPEMLVRKFLHANWLRYKLHDKSLPGKPDIVYVAVSTAGQTAGKR
jgi:DNA mismatch endonuclease (patch repair protein)